MPVRGARLCGARCRTKNGDPCLQPAMIGSNRCKMHFGHSRELIKHGRLTIQAKGERKEQKKLLREMKQLQKDLEQVAKDEKTVEKIH